MNQAIHTEDGTFVGFCYIHQGRKEIIEGTEGCQHEICIGYRNKPDSGTTMFNISKLKQQNLAATTDREMEQDVIDNAKAEGREIQRPTY